MHRVIDIKSSRRVKWLAVAVLFAFCQVVGVMCTLPTLSLAAHKSVKSEGGMVCPMDGTIMCPPSITSSPERQVKNSIVMDVDQALILFGTASALMNPSDSLRLPWSRAFFIVPTSIGSSSVLLI
jgi:hypothetical protein